MDEKRVLIEEFKKLQPYKDNVIKDPFGNEIIDVESINKSAFDKVINELVAVKKSKESSILILQGEPGSGKSHLLARIYRYAEIERFLFALYNPLLVKSGATYSSLLRSLFDSFERKHSELKSKPINHIRGEIVKIGLRNYNAQEEPRIQVLIKEIKNPRKTVVPYALYENFRALPANIQEKLRKIIAEEALQYVKEETEFKIGKKYLKAIIEAIIDENKYPVLRELISEGSLTREDAEKLNLTTGFSINEDIAFEIIQSIFVLSPFPILLSIDQIEHFDRHLDKDGIINFLEDLYNLVANTKNVLLLLSAQTAIFNKWRSFLPEYLKDRFSNTASLEGMSSEEGLEIIKVRNKYFFEKLGVKLDDPYFPFDKDDLLKKIKDNKLRSPRKVIELANAILEGALPEKKGVQEEFENILKKQIYNKDDFEDSLGELLATLFNAVNLSPRGKKLVLRVGEIAIGIDNSKNYYSTTRKLSSALRKKGLNKAIFVRDEKIPVREGTKSIELIRKNNIILKYYTLEAGKKLMALQKLISHTESKDIDLDLKDVLKFAIDLLKNFFEDVVSLEELNKSIDKQEGFKQIHKPKEESKIKTKGNKTVAEIVERIRSEFEEGKIQVARLSQYISKDQSSLVPEILKLLEKIPFIMIQEQENGKIFIAKKPS